MQKSVFFVLCCLLSLPAMGQLFDKGDSDLNIGAGINNNLYPGNKLHTTIPPATVSYEYGLNNQYGTGVIGVGGIIGFAAFKETIIEAAYPSGFEYTALFLGVRASYHLELVDNLDTYGGVTLFYITLDDDPFGPTAVTKNLSSKPGVWVYLGGKYYLNQRFGLFAELGFGSSVFKGGVCFKLY